MHTMRTIGLILAGIVLASFGVLAALILWLGTWPGVAVGCSIAAVVIGTWYAVIGPWASRWGATDAEVQRELPGDDILRRDAPSTTRAIGIEAPPAVVFGYLRQIGLGRGGWYSYDGIDNDGRPSVERIDPSLWFDVGDRIEMAPGFGPTVRSIDPGRSIVSASDTDAWTLVAEPSGGGTRLISRWRIDWPRTPATFAWRAIGDPGSFVMERKMLLRLKRVAERVAPETPRPLAA